MALKASFAVEEEGFDENVDEANEENRLLTFINYIKVWRALDLFLASFTRPDRLAFLGYVLSWGLISFF